MDVPETDVAQAKTLHADRASLFVDVRDPGSFAEAHVPGAVHLDDDTVQAFLEDTDVAAPIVIYCYHGHASLGATAYFRERGFTAVSSLAGGFAAWQAEGGPSEAGTGTS